MVYWQPMANDVEVVLASLRETSSGTLVCPQALAGMVITAVHERMQGVEVTVPSWFEGKGIVRIDFRIRYEYLKPLPGTWPDEAS